jgi:branched-chain amino acid transport system ATP-binding protein
MPKNDTILVVDHISVRYPNGAIGVSDVSLEVQAGQIVALFGPNGAGKTSTVRAVSGFLKSEHADVASGRVTFLGTDTTNREPHQIARMGVTFVPERRKIFPNMSIIENLNASGKRPPRRERARLLAEVFEMFPELGRRKHDVAGMLSGGQQQMVALARGLLNQSRLLIVDEMTLGLHHSLQPALFAVLRRVADSGASVLLVEENSPSTVASADDCFVLSGGRTVYHGPPADVAKLVPDDDLTIERAVN